MVSPLVQKLLQKPFILWNNPLESVREPRGQFLYRIRIQSRSKIVDSTELYLVLSPSLVIGPHFARVLFELQSCNSY